MRKIWLALAAVAGEGVLLAWFVGQRLWEWFGDGLIGW